MNISLRSLHEFQAGSGRKKRIENFRLVLKYLKIKNKIRILHLLFQEETLC